MTGKISVFVPTSTAEEQLWEVVRRLTFSAPLADDVTFTVTIVNNTFLRGIIQIMFH